MSIGLVIGIIVAVIALCSATIWLIRCWTARRARRRQRRLTQLYLLPQSVPAYSTLQTGSPKNHVITFFPVTDTANSVSRARSFSDVVSTMSDTSSARASRHFEQLNSVVESSKPRPRSSTPCIRHDTANDHSVPMAIDRVVSRRPAITRATTFTSQDAELASQDSIASSRRQQQRSMTITSWAASSILSEDGSALSVATGAFTFAETPIVATAVACDFRIENLPRASLIGSNVDIDVPSPLALPLLVPMEPIYLPYRPVPSD